MKRTELSLKALIVMMRSSQTVQDKIKNDMNQYGLNPTEFSVLELLYHKGDQPIQHIGKKILLASSSITYVVDKLEKKEYVVRKACPTDRRVIFASITEKGRAFMEDVFPKHTEVIEDIFGDLSEEQVEELIILLKKIGLKK